MLLNAKFILWVRFQCAAGDARFVNDARNLVYFSGRC
jgi:hypothetical protein